MADIEKHNPTDFIIVSPLVSKLSRRWRDNLKGVLRHSFFVHLLIKLQIFLHMSENFRIFARRMRAEREHEE